MDINERRKCRSCREKLIHVFADLGDMPPSNAYLSPDSDSENQKTYPLKVFVCHHCWLVQTEDFVDADEMFSDDYAYFSSISKGWLLHAENYTEMIINRLKLDKSSQVMEIASNDGYLLKNFVRANIPCLGIEPTIETSNVAKKMGIPVINDFFSEELSCRLIRQYGQYDLIIGNNVLAHVPNINDFIKGLKIALSSHGSITLEFPHLIELVDKNQFDTLYHEHYSYLSLTVVEGLFSQHQLKIYEVEKLTTHGGSLRIYICHENAPYRVANSVDELLEKEQEQGVLTLDYYQSFQLNIDLVKNGLQSFLQDTKREGKVVVGYGAAAKGNTLLNYAGITSKQLPVIFDAAPSKQQMKMPGSGILIKSPEHLEAYDPDYILILPWNIQSEIIEQLKHLKSVQFVTCIPELTII